MAQRVQLLIWGAHSACVDRHATPCADANACACTMVSVPCVCAQGLLLLLVCLCILRLIQQSRRNDGSKLDGHVPLYGFMPALHPAPCMCAVAHVAPLLSVDAFHQRQPLSADQRGSQECPCFSGVPLIMCSSLCPRLYVYLLWLCAHLQISEIAGVKLDKDVTVVGMADSSSIPLPPGSGMLDKDGKVRRGEGWAICCTWLFCHVPSVVLPICYKQSCQLFASGDTAELWGACMCDWQPIVAGAVSAITCLLACCHDAVQVTRGRQGQHSRWRRVPCAALERVCFMCGMLLSAACACCALTH
jgi:hypothetical protein